MNTYGIIFDLDGVIVSTDRYHYLAWKYISEKCNLHFDLHLYEKIKGVSREGSLEIILDHNKRTIDCEERNKLITEKDTIYKMHIKNMHRQDLIEGFYEFIHSVKKEKIKVAVGSSSKNANAILTKLGLLDLFDAVVDGNLIQKPKPDPEVFLKCSLILGVQPEKNIVFEDSEAGLIAAKRANMRTVYLGTNQDVSRAANLGIKSFRDIVTLNNFISEVFTK